MNIDPIIQVRLLSATSQFLAHRGALDPETSLALYEEREELRQAAERQREAALESYACRVMRGEVTLA